MRILAITNIYPAPGQPTAGPYNRLQLAPLVRQHELRVIRPVPWPMVLRDRLGLRPRALTETTADGITVYYPTFYYPPLMLRHLYGEFFAHSIAHIAGQLLRTFKPDVILACWAHPDGWAAVQLGKQAGLPVVVKVHGSDVLVLTSGRRRARIADGLKGADIVISVSQNLARKVVELGVAPERSRVVHEGIDPGQFFPGDRQRARERVGLADSRPMILFVGNLLVAKGVVDLIAACAVLRDRGVAFQCCVAGQGRDAHKVEEAVRNRQLSDRVVRLGYREHAELAHWYRASDVVALPSYSEGIPNVLREAMVCGRPFVATNVGGIPEVADPSFSRLVPPGNVLALADALQAVLAAPPTVDVDITRTLAPTWEQSSSLTARLLEEAIAGHAGGPANMIGGSLQRHEARV
jgi:glycosyltransferase involved in cell wall biosynthesis